MPHPQKEMSLKDYFVPLTTLKAIHFIVIIGFLVFGNALFNGFVLDDKTYIIHNKEIHTFDPVYLFQQNLFNSNGQYRPIPAVYFAAFYSWFGNTQFFYHVFSLIFHIINGILLFFLLKSLLNKKVSFFLSLLFLVHPMQVESVSYISAIASPLSFLFGILALLICIKDRLNHTNSFIVGALLLLSLLTKETGFLFIIMILLFRKLYKKKATIFFYFSIFISTLFYFLIRFLVGGVYFINPQSTAIQKLNVIERLINVPEIFFYYLKTFFFPIQLFVDQQWIITSINFKNFYLPLLIILSFIVIILFFGNYLHKKNEVNYKIYVFFSSWFLLGIFLYLQIFPLNITVADRWFYFPMVGLLGMIGVGLESIRFKKNRKKIFIILTVFLIITLSLRTIVRNTNWTDASILYTHDSKQKNNANIENSLGNEFLFKKNYKEAIIHLEKSVKMDPHEINLSNLATTYMYSGNTKKAKEYYLKTLNARRSSRNNHEKIVRNSYEQLAWIYVKSDDPNTSLIFVKSTLEKYPNSNILWACLAFAEYKLGNYDSALSAAEKAKTISPTTMNKYIYNQILERKEIKIN